MAANYFSFLIRLAKILASLHYLLIFFNSFLTAFIFIISTFLNSSTMILLGWCELSGTLILAVNESFRGELAEDSGVGPCPPEISLSFVILFAFVKGDCDYHGRV